MNSKFCHKALFVVFCLIFSLPNTLHAVQMNANRKKHTIEFGWNVQLTNFFTHNVIIDTLGDRSVISLLPKIGVDVVRNFTDKTFLIFWLSGGAPYVDISKSGAIESSGISFHSLLGGGRDLIIKGNFRFALAGGLDVRYLDLRSKHNLSSLQSNLMFGGFAWGGVKTSFEVNRKHSLSALFRFGIGYFGVLWSGESQVAAAFGILNSLRLEHSINLSIGNRFFWFANLDVPFVNALGNSSSQFGNTWFNHAVVDIGVGFAFGM